MNERDIDDLARNAYVDGRMDAAQRREVEAYLARHPDEAREIEAWRRDTQRLRAGWSDYAIPPNPVLDPAAVRTRLQGRRQARLAMAASLVVALTLGGVSGWQARGDTGAGRDAAPMQDAMQAYRVFASDHPPLADARAADTNLQQWMDGHFANAQRLPDLSAKGFRPVAVRLLVTDQGPSAMVIYENGDSRRTSFYIRPPGPGNMLLKQGQRRDGDLVAQYWSGKGYNYALVSRDDTPGIASG
jgi:anti-sigma factor RsiW